MMDETVFLYFFVDFLGLTLSLSAIIFKFWIRFTVPTYIEMKYERCAIDGIPKNKRMIVCPFIELFLETGRVKDRVRNGRPESVTTPMLKKVIRSRVGMSPGRSTRKMAAS